MSGHEAQHVANELQLNLAGFHFRTAEALDMDHTWIRRPSYPISGWFFMLGPSLPSHGCRGAEASAMP